MDGAGDLDDDLDCGGAAAAAVGRGNAADAGDGATADAAAELCGGAPMPFHPEIGDCMATRTSAAGSLFVGVTVRGDESGSTEIAAIIGDAAEGGRVSIPREDSWVSSDESSGLGWRTVCCAYLCGEVNK